MSVRVLALDPGKTTGWFLTRGYEPVKWGEERDATRIFDLAGEADVVVYEDALDLDQVERLKHLYRVPWVGVTPEQLQRRLFSRTLSRKLNNGPLARQEAIRRGFGLKLSSVHALDAACLALWWLAGSDMAVGAPDLGGLRVWDFFTVADEFGEETYQIVPPNTADPDQNMVSWAAPLVEAVKGAQPGQQVVVKAPGGDWSCTFVRVEPRDF